MNLELRNIKFLPSGSEETYCFTADVYIDGKIVGNASNAGRGGSTDIHGYSHPKLRGHDEKQIAEIRANRKVLDTYDAWAKSLPPTPVGDDEEQWVKDLYPTGRTRDLEGDVDDFFDNWVRTVFIPKKENTRYKRLCKDKVVYLRHSQPDYEFTLSTQFVKSLGEALSRDLKGDLKEIINHRFLPESEHADLKNKGWKEAAPANQA